jgi:hypothetical protein
MALKTWIKDIKTAEGGSESEALPGQVSGPGTGTPIIRCADYPLPGEKEADAILFGARDEIIKGGVFHFTPETKAAEVEVNRTYKAILDGGRDFVTLRAACVRWVEVARKPPAPPVMAELFPPGAGRQ